MRKDEWKRAFDKEVLWKKIYIEVSIYVYRYFFWWNRCFHLYSRKLLDNFKAKIRETQEKLSVYLPKHNITLTKMKRVREAEVITPEVFAIQLSSKH